MVVFVVVLIKWNMCVVILEVSVWICVLVVVFVRLDGLCSGRMCLRFFRSLVKMVLFF